MLIVASYSLSFSMSSVFFNFILYYIYLSADFDTSGGKILMEVFFILDSAKGVFAEQSSTEQWLQKGEEFMKQSLYEVAAKCFNRGENYHMEKIAKAHHLASLAARFVLSLLLTFKILWKKRIIK